MSRKKKNIEAPAVTHGSSKNAQHQWFQEEAGKFARKAHSDKGGAGKGSRPRTSINSPQWQENAAELFSYKPFWQRRKEENNENQ